VPFQGPVGGICCGLQAASSENCFVTSCDAPFLNLALIRSFVAALGDADVAVPPWRKRLQSLHAVYRKSVRDLPKQQLGEEKLPLTILYEQVKTRIIADDQLRVCDPEGLSFINLNTLADFQQALRRSGCFANNLPRFVKDPSEFHLSSVDFTGA